MILRRGGKENMNEFLKKEEEGEFKYQECWTIFHPGQFPF